MVYFDEYHTLFDNMSLRKIIHRRTSYAPWHVLKRYPVAVFASIRYERFWTHGSMIRFHGWLDAVLRLLLIEIILG